MVQPPTALSPPDPLGWTERRVLFALTGGIACYKAASVISRLAQHGADVRVLMTESAIRFLAPLTCQSLSGKPVITSMWQSETFPDAPHIGLARWCEMMLIAPATAHTIAKIAHGLCDDIVSLSACALPQSTPLLIAPAMNSDMWQNPMTQANLQRLRELRGVQYIGPDSGWQACRTEGQGRLSEPEAIFAAATAALPTRST